MTTPRNPDRLIRTYLQEDQAPGQPEVPEHVYGAIRDGIEQTRQRAVIGSMGVPDMNKFLAIGLGAAAVVAVLLIGSNLHRVRPALRPAATRRVLRRPPKPRHPSRRLRSKETTWPPLRRAVRPSPDERACSEYERPSPIPAPRLCTGFRPSRTSTSMAWPCSPQGAGLIAYGGDLLVYGDPVRLGVDPSGRPGRLAR